ncbi:MAG: hypothetical protein AB7N76_20020 [Planctomycetota bacterium]
MGFRIREEMAGEQRLEGQAGTQPFAFRIAWGPDRLRDWLDPTGERFLWQELEGEVRAGGLCDWTPCRGTLELDYARARIEYRFDFEVDGVTYRYVGEKRHIRPWNLHVSHTTCYGDLRELETGRLVGTSVTRFRLRDLPSFLGSLRWA